jgi:ribosomal protein S18 acetylase RimI-like enzyme
MIQVTPTEIKDILIRPAQRKDVISISEIMMANFAYVYTVMFETSFSLTKEIFKRILAVNGGNYIIGYKTYTVAFDTNTGKIAGLIALYTKQRKRDLIIGTISSALVLLKYIGIVGLIRTRRNLHKLNDIIPKVHDDELYISYIAVPSEFKKQGIGQQLIKFAISSADSSAKTSIVLDVREKNEDGIAFFKALNFQEESRSNTPDADNALGMGRSIHMRLKLS